MQRYETAKILLQFLIIIGWIFVAIAVVSGAAAMSEIGILYAFIATALISIIGFLTIATAQMGLAQIATAENTSEMLQIMKRQGGQQSAGISTVANTHYSTRASTSGPKAVGDKIKVYKGYVIKKASSGVEVEGREFNNVIIAEQWINDNPKA